MTFGRRDVRNALVRSPLFGLARQWRAQPPLILMYHGVSSQPASTGLRNFDRKHLPPATFAAHLKHLQRHRKVIPLADMVAALIARDDLRGTVAITLDDGYENNAVVAAPILADFNLPAAFFLTTGLIGSTECIWTDRLEIAFDRTPCTSFLLPGSSEPAPIASREQKRDVLVRLKSHLKAAPASTLASGVAQALAQLKIASGPADGDYRFMDWTQARALVTAGFEVGAHTVSHTILSKMPFEDAVSEILRSREDVMRETGQCSTTFCFPNGKQADFTPRLAQFCKTYFAAAISTERGPARVDDLFSLKRLSPPRLESDEEFAWMLFRGA